MKLPKQKLQKFRKLNKLTVYKTLTWVFGVIILLGLVLFLSRGWVRSTAEPKAASLFYGHSVQTTLDKQVSAFGDPLNALKYAHINKHAAKCGLVLARSVHTQIECIASYQAYGVVSSDKQTLRANATALQAKLDKAGWSGNPSKSLTQFINGITDGADNQPDATYMMHFGDTICMLSTTTAFSKPKPPAMNTIFSCNRDVTLFGSPFPSAPNATYF